MAGKEEARFSSMTSNRLTVGIAMIASAVNPCSNGVCLGTMGSSECDWKGSSGLRRP